MKKLVLAVAVFFWGCTATAASTTTARVMDWWWPFSYSFDYHIGMDVSELNRWHEPFGVGKDSAGRKISQYKSIEPNGIPRMFRLPDMFITVDLFLCLFIDDKLSGISIISSNINGRDILDAKSELFQLVPKMNDIYKVGVEELRMNSRPAYCWLDKSSNRAVTISDNSITSFPCIAFTFAVR